MQLKNKVDIYNYICLRYSEIGKKIFCSLDDKDRLLHIVDDCYNETVNILNEYEKIDMSFFNHSIQNEERKKGLP